MADDILSLKFDIYDVTNDCVERKNDRGQIENKLYVKEMREMLNDNSDHSKENNKPNQDGAAIDIKLNFQFPLGYGSEVDIGEKNDNNFCYEHDMIRFLTRDVAQTCLNIVNEGCSYLKERMCPCFNIQDLLSTMQLNHNIAHCTNTKQGTLGLYVNNDTNVHDPLFALERNLKGNCMRGNDAYEINEDQYEHCLEIFLFTCKYYFEDLAM